MKIGIIRGGDVGSTGDVNGTNGANNIIDSIKIKRKFKFQVH